MSVALAVVDVRRGCVVRYLGEPDEALEAFGALVPELFSVERSAWAYGAFERVRAGSSAAFLCELLIVAPDAVHVAHRLPWLREHALIALGPWASNVGVILSAVREALRALEADALREGVQ